MSVCVCVKREIERERGREYTLYLFEFILELMSCKFKYTLGVFAHAAHLISTKSATCALCFGAVSRIPSFLSLPSGTTSVWVPC